MLKDFFRLGLAAAVIIGLGLLVFKPKTNWFETAQLASVVVQPEGSSGNGSGFIIKRKSPDGVTRVFLWTANHVVEDNTKASVLFFVRRDNIRIGAVKYRADLVARFEDSDTALFLIHAPAELFTSINFNTDLPKVGDNVFVVGSPHGAEHDNMITEGIVSQIGFDFLHKAEGWSIIDQTTAELNYGNSGGPVLDKAGVIGIAVGTEFNGIGFYVPTRAVFSVAEHYGFGWAVIGEVCPEIDKIKFSIDQRRYE